MDRPPRPRRRCPSGRWHAVAASSRQARGCGWGRIDRQPHAVISASWDDRSHARATGWWRVPGRGARSLVCPSRQPCVARTEPLREPCVARTEPLRGEDRVLVCPDPGRFGSGPAQRPPGAMTSIAWSAGTSRSLSSGFTEETPNAPDISRAFRFCLTRARPEGFEPPTF
jgi:hypothetical protein